MIGNLSPRTMEDNSFSSRFVITMWLEPSGQTFVRSCEVIRARFRNRTSFGEAATIENAFSERMADAIKGCLSKLSMRSEVLALPTYAIELPHLALAGATIVATKVANGTINIIMRFKTFLGSINTAFREDIGIDHAISDHNSALGAKVLGDIAAPLLDICAAIETGSTEVAGRLGDFGRNIASRSDELRFHIELLNRFVQQEAQSTETRKRFAQSQAEAVGENHHLKHRTEQPRQLVN